MARMTALQVRSGVVGHIKLTVPVSRLRSEPWTLLLEKISIVLGIGIDFSIEKFYILKNMQ
jgi:hypothetical protein